MNDTYAAPMKTIDPMEPKDPAPSSVPRMNLYIGQGGRGSYGGRVRRRGLLPAVGHYVRENLLSCLLAALYLLGLLAGALLVSRSDPQTKELLDVVLGGYMEKRGAQSFAALAISSFGSMALLIVVLFFCGFCTISQPIIFLIPVFKGLGYGFTIGALYAEHGLAAVRYVSVLVFPVLFLGALLLICASRTAFLLSVRLLRTTLAPSDSDSRARMRRYLVKYFTYCICCLLIALLDAAIVFRFGGLFPL